MVKLIEIVDIRAGYSFREGLSKAESGDLPVVQFKDISNLYIDDVSACFSISDEKIKPSHLLRRGDVLLSNRGNYKATLFNTTAKSIASGVFFILTIKDKSFLPEYIATFLNSAEGQKALSERQNSAGMPSIIRSELEQIDIPFISLEKQRQIVELFMLYEKEVDTMEKIKQNRKKLVNSILSQIVKE
ncbi:MAG: restriction endonuclease subunit S [Alphaproteobacteria bacterium]|nr:restriction endonuclease subunit S [Alphaproteobacteria bacterium]